MKSITIPTNCNPYIVVINNHVYTYRAGDSVEVPDEVAEVIEDALELEPKPKRYISQLGQIAEERITEITSRDLGEIETISYYAFAYCRNMVSMEIPKSVKTIGDGAFYGCLRLERLKFESNSRLESIGNMAFYSCKLSSVYLPETPPVLSNTNAFQSIKTGCVFYCKTQASLEAYREAPNWSTLAGTYSFVVEA